MDSPKVMVSSCMDADMAPWRQAARLSIKAISGVPLMAEDFHATGHSPQVACLSLVAQADVIIHLAGRRYGSELPAGISATEAELHEARRLGKHVLSFHVCETREMEARQSSLVTTMRDWQTGTISPKVTSTDNLIEKVGPAIQNLRSRPSREDAADAVNHALKIVLPGAGHSSWTSAPWAGISWTPRTHAPFDESTLFGELPDFVVDALLTSPLAACNRRPEVRHRLDSIEIIEVADHSQAQLRVHLGLDGTIAFAGAMASGNIHQDLDAAFRSTFHADAEAAESRLLQGIQLGHAIINHIDPGRSVPEFLHQAAVSHLAHRTLSRANTPSTRSIQTIGANRQGHLLAFDAPSSATRENFSNPAPHARMLADRLVRAAGDDLLSVRH